MWGQKILERIVERLTYHPRSVLIDSPLSVPNDFAQRLVEFGASSGVRVSRVSAREESQEWAQPDHGDIIVVGEVAPEVGTDVLGRVRATTQAWGPTVRVLFMSQKCASAYPIEVSSTLFADASPLVPEHLQMECWCGSGEHDCPCAIAGQKADGLWGLAERYHRLGTLEMSNGERRRQALREKREAITSALCRLSDADVQQLDAWATVFRLTSITLEQARRHRETVANMRSVGLMGERGEDGYPLFATGLADIVPEILSDHVEAQYATSQWQAEAWQNMYKIERSLRWAVSRKLGTAKIRDLLETTASSIEYRAGLESFGPPLNLADVARPLDYVSIDKLIDICISESSGDGFLNWPTAKWVGLRERLPPIRNRIAHFRLLHPEDGSYLTLVSSQSVPVWRTAVAEE